MSERRKGLGRGLGALLENTESPDRPVDVFFPVGNESSESKKKYEDPAFSMRKAATARNGVSRETGDPHAGEAGSPQSVNAQGGNTASTGPKKRSSKASVSRETGKSSNSHIVPSPAPVEVESRGPRDSDDVNATSEMTSGGDAGGADSTVIETETTEAQLDPRPGATGSAQTEPPSPKIDVSRETQLVPVEGATYAEVPVDQIRMNPKNPRTVFDEDSLAELVHSIQEVGILQPVVVRPAPEGDEFGYELIMGERRFRAVQQAGMDSIPAIVRGTADEHILRDALLENLHRVDLNPLEEAAAYEQLLSEFGCTQEELSERIGRSRPQISNTLRLLKLPALVQRRVAAGVISSGHARAILGLHDPAGMEVLAQRIVAEGFSVRATEEAVIVLNQGISANAVGSRSRATSSPELSTLASRIGDRLDTRVSITMGRRKGKISVEFAGADDLERILNELKLAGLGD